MSRNKQKKKPQIKHTLDVENEHDDQLSYDSIDDEQYLNLLQGNLPKSHKNEINLGQKYQGKAKAQKEESEQEIDDESINSDEIPDFVDDQQEAQNEEDEEQQTQNNTKKKQSIKKIPVTKFQKELQQIEQEDLQMIEKSKENKKELAEVSSQIKEQLSIWGNLVEIREQMQKSLELVKKLPLNNEGFANKLQESKDSKLNSLNFQLLNNLSNLQLLYSSLYPIELVDIQKDGFDTSLTTKINESLEKSKQSVEDDVIKWSSKSALLSQMNKNRDSKSQSGFLLLTPIGQCSKALQNIEKLKYKTQLKRQIFRILGEDAADLSEITNKHIYDDTDFYLDLLKESIQSNNENQQEELMKKETEQYILKRQAQREEKQTKVVDRKASKNRKVRYDLHEKIINFVSRKELPIINYSREDIIANLFGIQSSEPKIIKKRKDSVHDINLF